MNTSDKPTIIVIVGITGDLSTRYLLPAIEKIAHAHALPEHVSIIGVTRRAVSTADVLQNVSGSTTFLQENLSMCQMDLSVQADYERLKQHIQSTENAFGEPAQKLFYLSVPPQASQPVIKLLGKTGHIDSEDTKLLLEKPFGSDLPSADELIVETKQHFSEDQIYRIDHYLAKEMAQNLVIFRQVNPLLAHTWNSSFIEKVDIVASESIDIEGRSVFYEQTGALRDVLQSHVLQLAALTLMDISTNSTLSIPERRLNALRQLHVRSDKPLQESVIRGQYMGYSEEVNNDGSTVETFVSLTLESKDPQWAGVPIQLTTGKALSKRETVIHITYKSDHGLDPNMLTIRIQPNAGIELNLWAKAPGYDNRLEQQTLNFKYQDQHESLPDAYEQVFLDAIHSNHNLFTSSEEVRESWRILEPIQHAWSLNSSDIILYDKGSDAHAIGK